MFFCSKLRMDLFLPLGCSRAASSLFALSRVGTPPPHPPYRSSVERAALSCRWYGVIVGISFPSPFP